jgi:predicted porin
MGGFPAGIFRRRASTGRHGDPLRRKNNIRSPVYGLVSRSLSRFSSKPRQSALAIRPPFACGIVQMSHFCQRRRPVKKNALLLAVLGAAATTAAAQSPNVTIYGRVNTSIESQKTTGVDRTTVLQNNSSRWGIKGDEDLGGGMKAFLFLESGFGSDDGRLSNDGGIFNRESFAGLSGGFGALRAGRITSPAYFASADYVSMHNHDTGTSSDFLFGFAATGGNNNNSITYKTPSLGFGDVEIAYSLAASGSEQPGSNNLRNTQVAYNYVGGPLHIGAGWAQMDDKRTGTSAKDETAVIRALYEMGPFTVGGYYERSKLQFAGQRRSRNNFRVAGMYAMGASEFHLNFGLADDFSGTDSTGAKQFTVAYNYNLSKRTKVYAFYTQVDEDSNGTYYLGATPGAKFSSFAAGLRHNF